MQFLSCITIFQVIDCKKNSRIMSYTFPAWPYPYPHETVFDGLDQMECPMMVNDNPLKTGLMKLS
jgi:hypothetical protein